MGSRPGIYIHFFKYFVLRNIRFCIITVYCQDYLNVQQGQGFSFYYYYYFSFKIILKLELTMYIWYQITFQIFVLTWRGQRANLIGKHLLGAIKKCTTDEATVSRRPDACCYYSCAAAYLIFTREEKGAQYSRGTSEKRPLHHLFPIIVNPSSLGKIIILCMCL